MFPRVLWLGCLERWGLKLSSQSHRATFRPRQFHIVLSQLATVFRVGNQSSLGFCSAWATMRVVFHTVSSSSFTVCTFRGACSPTSRLGAGRERGAWDVGSRRAVELGENV